MKKLLLFLLLLSLACTSDDPEIEILGEWQLVEVLADPGDGSGKFKSVDSNKRITFFEDGSYTSNGIICDFTTSAEEASGGQYTIDEDGYLIPCSDPVSYTVGLRLEDGFLIISFPCIEPCLQKFRKQS
ncbi:MAG: hypothetical protein KJO20_11230 [Eudoraea sp.]|nr:hypothetical protein [Eudoraea sp.]NNK29372.1 hypothetical protein [Flavobacteriaceae bacterium]